jgi:hypothetical protein
MGGIIEFVEVDVLKHASVYEGLGFDARDYLLFAVTNILFPAFEITTDDNHVKFCGKRLKGARIRLWAGR